MSDLFSGMDTFSISARIDETTSARYTRRRRTSRSRSYLFRPCDDDGIFYHFFFFGFSFFFFFIRNLLFFGPRLPMFAYYFRHTGCPLRYYSVLSTGRHVRGRKTIIEFNILPRTFAGFYVSTDKFPTARLQQSHVHARSGRISAISFFETYPL